MVEPSIIKGRNKSGRFWKSERDRFRSIVKVKPLKKSLSKRIIEKKERNEMVALNRAIKAEKENKYEELKKRQQLNKERRQANEKKSEVVQVFQNMPYRTGGRLKKTHVWEQFVPIINDKNKIKDSKKIKKMSRKQLRHIEKRDTSQIS